MSAVSEGRQQDARRVNIKLRMRVKKISKRCKENEKKDARKFSSSEHVTDSRLCEEKKKSVIHYLKKGQGLKRGSYH